MNWYWGDLHSHTNLSYGRGTVDRALRIADQHLDFCSITGHAFWPDMPEDLRTQDATISMHLGGFAKCQRYWESYLQAARQFQQEHGLVVFPSYEWHSDRYGDYNIYSRTGELPLTEFQHVSQFESFFDPADYAIAPHHIGYTEGNRGIDWDAFAASRLTRFVEVYSNHGSALSDAAPYDYYHEMGPRDGRRTVEEGLGRGLKFGFIASTDTHDGFPGHYSHGRAGVLAETKSPEALWDALMNRRTVAVTGARIQPTFQINDAGIGSVIQAGRDRRIRLRLQGNQPFRQVALVRNGQIIHVDATRRLQPSAARGVYYVKLEWGWGRKDRVVHWDGRLEIEGGSQLGVEPCFRHTIFNDGAEEAPHRILDQDERGVAWVSDTRGVPDSYVHNPQTMTCGVNALVLRIEGGADTKLRLRTSQLDIDATLEQLIRGSVVEHAGGHCSCACRIGRAYPEQACTVEAEITDAPEREEDYYYLWGTQIDNESIWVTPIWAQR